MAGATAAKCPRGHRHLPLARTHQCSTVTIASWVAFIEISPRGQTGRRNQGSLNRIDDVASAIGSMSSLSPGSPVWSADGAPPMRTTSGLPKAGRFHCDDFLLRCVALGRRRDINSRTKSCRKKMWIWRLRPPFSYVFRNHGLQTVAIGNVSLLS
jgi:hypothetical protein